MAPICLLALTIGDQAGDCTADGCRATALLTTLPGTACVCLRRGWLAVPCRTARPGIAGSTSRWPLQPKGRASCVCCLVALTWPAPREPDSVGGSPSSPPVPQWHTLSGVAFLNVRAQRVPLLLWSTGRRRLAGRGTWSCWSLKLAAQRWRWQWRQCCSGRPYANGRNVCSWAADTRHAREATVQDRTTKLALAVRHRCSWM